MAKLQKPGVSIVVPVFNEEENVARMHEEIAAVLPRLGREGELIFVDDGSRDRTPELLREIAERDDRVRVVLLRRNYGQAAAMHAGIQHAGGEVIVTLDGDLQNDPADIPALLAAIDAGHDLAHGWRRERQDTWLDRRLPSQLANALIAWTTGVPLHDLGCTLKAIRREVAQELELHGEMHRFLAILAHHRGARICEVETHHRPRLFGQTKYGLSRVFRVVLDLLTVKYLTDFAASPLKFFGALALSLGAVGTLLAVAAVVCLTLSLGGWGLGLGLAAGFCGLASLQLLGQGLLGEQSARIYHTDDRQPWSVRELVNFGSAARSLPLSRAA